MKKCVIVSAVTALATIALMILVIAGIKIVPSLFLTEEERVLRDFMGEYVNVGFARMVDGKAKTMPLRWGNGQPGQSTYFILDERSIVELDGSIFINTQMDFFRTCPLKYSCVKIENAKDQGLCNYDTNEQFYQATDEDVYGIFVYDPGAEELNENDGLSVYREKSNHQRIYYVVGDKYYVSANNKNYELKKVV